MFECPHPNCYIYLKDGDELERHRELDHPACEIEEEGDD